MRATMCFPLPKPVSMHPEYFRPCVWNSVVHAETSKNEDTWYGMLWYYDTECDTARRVLDGQWWPWRHAIQYCAARTAIVTCFTSTSTTTVRGTGTTTGSTTIVTPTTPRPCSQPSLFLPRFAVWRGGGVLFFKLATPTAEIFTDLFDGYWKRNVLFVLKRAGFPKNHQKHF